MHYDLCPCCCDSADISTLFFSIMSSFNEYDDGPGTKPEVSAV